MFSFFLNICQGFDLHDFKHQMKLLSDQLTAMADIIADQQHEIRELKSQVHTSNTIVKKHTFHIQNLQNENKKLRGFCDEKVPARNNFVGFSAYPTETRSHGDTERVLFDGVISNYGNAESVFTCPVSGYYMFFTDVHANPDESFCPEIYYGRRSIFPGTYAEDGTNSSTMLIIYCQSGQQVWVRAYEGGQLRGGQPVSTFSGALIELETTEI